MTKLLFKALLILLPSICVAQQNIYYSVRYTGDTAVLHTAKDFAFQLERATGNTFVPAPMPGVLPATGIFLIADSTLPHSMIQECIINCNGTDNLTLTSTYAFGLSYGVYQYLEKLGFRFYLPDPMWEVVPQLSSPFMLSNETVKANFIYKTMLATGFPNYFPMDTTRLSWARWSKWMDRNNFNGDRQAQGQMDWNTVLNPLMAADPCYIAEHDGLQYDTLMGVPNCTNTAALDIWSNYFVQRSKDYLAYAHGTLEPQNTSQVGIEVVDGAQWGNTNTFSCLNGMSSWPEPNEQNFIINNYVAEMLADSLPQMRAYCLAYNSAADTPAVAVHPNIDVMITQAESVGSYVGLLNRWKIKNSGRISEYMYFSIPDEGQPPQMDMSFHKIALQRMLTWGTQGANYETGLSKFSTGAHLYAMNRFMKDSTSIDDSYNEFFTDMFGAAKPKIVELFDLWTDVIKYTDGPNVNDNMHRMPLYLKLLSEADQLESDTTVHKRINEIKAYLHYNILYMKFTQAGDSARFCDNGDLLCHYLAEITDRNLVNSFRMLQVTANRLSHYDTLLQNKWYPEWPFWNKYNYVTETYFEVPNDPVWATIQPLTDATIESNFAQDLAEYTYPVNYQFTTLNEMFTRIENSGNIPKDTIHFKFYFDSGNTLAGYNIHATGPGTFTFMYDSLTPDLNFTPYLRLTVNLDSKDQLYSQENMTTDTISPSGQFTFTIPEAGEYVLSINKANVGMAKFKIACNNNLFYLIGGQGNVIQSIEEDDYATFIYVPAGATRVYVTLPQTCDNLVTGCWDMELLNASFIIRQPNGTQDTLYRSEFDSTMYYFTIPPGKDDNFWRFYEPLGAGLIYSLSNLSNVYFCLQPGVTNGLSELKQPELSVFPNPSKGNISLLSSIERKDLTISLLDLNGRQIIKKHVSLSANSPYELGMNIEAGAYVMQIEQKNAVTVSKKIIVLH